MEIRTTVGTLDTQQVDTWVVGVFEGAQELKAAAGQVDAALDGGLLALLQSGEFTGKAGEVIVVYTFGKVPAGRVLLVGLGKEAEFDLEAVRRASGAAVNRGRDLGAQALASELFGAGRSSYSTADVAQAMAEGGMLALYDYRARFNQKPPRNNPQTLVLVAGSPAEQAALEEGVHFAQASVPGVVLARDLVNLPPNTATPTYLSTVAEEIAQEYGMKLTVGDREWAQAMNMGAFLCVARGAEEPPKFIVLEYNAERAELPTVVLVGKGITFDSGGISIKPSDKMDEMKSDMAGAAAVLAVMKSAGELKLPLHLVGITPCTENMPDGRASRPADVVTASNGKTIEIISTDAEGRLILADALVYASRYNPAVVIDLATLTGACVIALGDNIAAGLFCNDDELSQRLVESGSKTFERLWPMPLWDDYKKAIESRYADIKNTGGRYGGVGTSAIFLKQFIDYRWAHLDIAGMALADKELPYQPAGGTGYGVRLLLDYLRNYH
ncbi:MAG TPA: leucyl aminopeptidase [Anaerolineales bacterium]|nr:leucyl aminopeptidase [Anaerolineales bacterium]